MINRKYRNKNRPDKPNIPRRRYTRPNTGTRNPASTNNPNYDEPISFELTLKNGQNLISFPIFPDVGHNIEDVFTDSRIKSVSGHKSPYTPAAATRLENGEWVGALTTLEQNKSYYVDFDMGGPGSETFTYTGVRLYHGGNLHLGISPYFYPFYITPSIGTGVNYIAFPFMGCYALSDLMNDELWHSANSFSAMVRDGIIVELFGEDSAASYVNDNWVGSLQELCGGKGYKMKVTASYETMTWPSILPHPGSCQCNCIRQDVPHPVYTVLLLSEILGGESPTCYSDYDCISICDNYCETRVDAYDDYVNWSYDVIYPGYNGPDMSAECSEHMVF